MNSQNHARPSLVKIYNEAFNLLKSKPILMFPFVTFAVIDALALTIIFLAPRKPFLSSLGPIIKTFWGEKFLHYPYNFLLLPKLESFSRMGLTVIFASLLTGMAVAMIADFYKHKSIKIESAFKAAIKKYVYLFIAVFLFTGLFYLLSRAINSALISYFVLGHRDLFFIKGPAAWGPILLCINFFLSMFTQAAFIYVIPILIIENKKFIQSLVQSLLMFERFFIFTILLVGLPMLLYIPIIILNFNTVLLIKEVYPELVLIVSFLGIIVSALIIDPLITTSAALIYLENRNKQ